MMGKVNAGQQKQLKPHVLKSKRDRWIEEWRRRERHGWRGRK